MQIKLIILILLLVLFCGEAHTEKIGILEDILNPFYLRVSKDIIYISDQYYIWFYSNKLNLLKKIGGKGEGPGNFLINPAIKILQNNILTYTPSRFAVFSKNGELLNQPKYNGILWDVDIVKGNYIISRIRYETNAQIPEFVVMDSNFKEIKTINSIRIPSASPMKKTKKFLVQPLEKFQCYNDEIYVVSSRQEGFSLYVFDNRGTPLRTITRDYDKIKISPAEREKILDNFKNIPVVKRKWQSLTRIFDYTFPEYFPAIQDFRISMDRIYVKTYKSCQNEVEFVILNLDGKFLGKTFLPDIKERHFDIDNNKFYYLKDNEENEVWELHVVNIHTEIDSKKK